MGLHQAGGRSRQVTRIDIPEELKTDSPGFNNRIGFRGYALLRKCQDYFTFGGSGRRHETLLR